MIVPTKLPEKWPWPVAITIVAVGLSALLIWNNYAVWAHWKGGDIEVAPAQNRGQLPPTAAR